MKARQSGWLIVKKAFMKKSLKIELYEAIKEAYPNMFSIERVNGLCAGLGYKQSNAERRLRELCQNSAIRAVYSEKRYIMGYIYKQPVKVNFEPNIKPQDNLFKYTPHSYKYE